MNFCQVLSASCYVWVIEEGAGSAAGIRNGLLSLNTSFHHQRLLANVITDSRETGKAPFTDKLSQSSAKRAEQKELKIHPLIFVRFHPTQDFKGQIIIKGTKLTSEQQTKNHTPPHAPPAPALLVPYTADLKSFLGYARLLGTGQLRNVSLELSTPTWHIPVAALEIKQDPSPQPSLHIPNGSSGHGLLSKRRLIFSSKVQVWQVFLFRWRVNKLHWRLDIWFNWHPLHLL